MALMLTHCLVLVLLWVCDTASTTDYGGIPLWTDHMASEPSVLSLQGRMERAWFRANNPQDCPQQCDCPIQWPTAIYCDRRGLRDIPDQAPVRTQYLFLQYNNISSLSPFLTNLTDLRWLILDHNQLQKLDQAALQDKTQLCNLFANHNHLKSVPSNLPAGIMQLRLAHNQISSISPGAFQNLHNLTMLLLQGNRLQTITGGDLKGLLSLTLLDLTGNLFSSVPRHLPHSVQQLYLSNNNISQLNDNSFMGLSKLQYLRLSHCSLQSDSIHPQAFNISSLMELDLSYNKLTVVPTVPMTLQYLYLEANKIQEFNLTSFCREVGPQSYSRMKVLRLDGNKMSYRHLPADWMFCLRELESIYL